jgi:hypothetical protein
MSQDVKTTRRAVLTGAAAVAAIAIAPTLTAAARLNESNRLPQLQNSDLGNSSTQSS